MRIAAAASFLAVLMAGCSSTAEAPATVRAPEDVALPDFKPETAAACNAERLSIEVRPGGAVVVNGASSSLEGMKAAAARKNAACLNAPAVVLLAFASGVPEREADAIRETLAKAIVNITLVETR